MKTRSMKRKIKKIRIDSDNKKMSIYNVPKENNYKTNYT